MSYHFEQETFADQAVVHQSPSARNEVDRTFELPAVTYKLAAGLYFAFIAIMSVSFGNPQLVIPMAICVIFVTMFFAMPTIWVKMKPASRSKSLTWGQLHTKGVATLTGRLSARDAMAQVLVLPVLIVFWALAVGVIAATV